MLPRPPSSIFSLPPLYHRRGYVQLPVCRGVFVRVRPEDMVLFLDPRVDVDPHRDVISRAIAAMLLFQAYEAATGHLTTRGGLSHLAAAFTALRGPTRPYAVLGAVQAHAHAGPATCASSAQGA